MVFRIETDLTAEDRDAWRRLAVQRDKAARAKRRKAVRSWLGDKLCGVLGTAVGVLVLYLLACGGMRIGWLIFALIVLVGGPWMFLETGRCPKAELASLPGRDFPPPGMTDLTVRAVFFGDGCFVLWDGSGKIRLGYPSIAGAWEDEGRFYLFFKDRPPLVLPKRGLGRWMPEDFRDFLERELGTPVERVRP